MPIKFFANKNDLERYITDYWEMGWMIKEYEKLLSHLIFPNIFLLGIDGPHLKVEAIPREEIVKFNCYCEDTWK
jgi:hypothetical protein